MTHEPNSLFNPMRHGARKAAGKRGFALIVTLSLMILLVVVAVGLLGLASISLRSGGQEQAQAQAQANARLALMLALGELQKSLGPDQAVSAPASAVVESPSQPHLTGAWRSWRWTPSATGSPTYGDKKSQFRNWLVSTANPEDAGNFEFASAAEPTGVNAVRLVGDPANPLSNSANTPISVTGGKVKVGSGNLTGKYAWAVFDESTKASVNLGDPATTPNAGIEIASRTVPRRFRADALDPKLESLKTPVNLISLETAAIPAGKDHQSEIRRRFHDFTTGAMGLLTDTAKGGLKTDLTSLFEPANLPGGAFVAPTAVTPYDGFSISAGAPKWAYLRDHYRKYKSVKTPTTEPTYSPVPASDLKINTSGVTQSPDNERLIPAIAKFQLVFSLVAHYANISDRVRFLDSSGDPKGNQNHAVVHLAYDPVITLYNPYDVTLNLQKIRIRVWDPPVGFRFTKIDKKAGTSVFFRPPQAGQSEAEFFGMARFHIDQNGKRYESNPNARKCFTLVLADGTDNAISNGLKLRPGEVKIFSPRVEPNWTWGLEVGGGDYRKRSFFDWEAGANFGNVDARSPNGLGKFGVEAVPGWQWAAGLQTDHLSTAARDPSTLYAFEKAPGARIGGFVSLRLTDEVMVEAKPKVVAGGAQRHFQVDVLAGLSEGISATQVETDLTNSGVGSDRLRSYIFNFDGVDPAEEISQYPKNPVIEMRHAVSNILQKPDEGRADPKRPGLKRPFAMLEMSARTTVDELNDSKPWLYNNFIVEGSEQNTKTVGLTHQSYDLRLIPITSLIGFPDGIAIDPVTKRGYFGSSDSLENGGSSFVSMLHVPMAPAASLGDLIPSNLVAGSQLPRVVNPFGNSRAHPLIPSSKVSQTTGTSLLDHSYLLNDGLWDSYYFSSITAYGGSQGGVIQESKSVKEVLTGVFEGTEPALNNRLVPVSPPGDPEKAADEVAGLSDLERSRQLGKYLAVNGSFNVNSTSVDAWRSMLCSLRDRQINGLKLQGATGASVVTATYPNDGETPFVRAAKPLAGSTPEDHLRWAGFRALSDSEIKGLAEGIVREITLRGAKDNAPALTLGEFVNRRPGSANEIHSLAGLLQTAIDKSKVNERFHLDPATGSPKDSKVLSVSTIPPKRIKGVQTREVLDGYSGEGAPSMLTQGDLMSVLAPVATVRGDTFKIRCYGEATSSDGKSVLARVWCEAVVQRVPGFVDSADLPETPIASLSSDVNRTFGRRFNIVSFRWLEDGEI